MTSEKTGCVHHWEIASPDGPLSLGVCRECGERRMFDNVGTWDMYRGPGRPKKAQPRSGGKFSG